MKVNWKEFRLFEVAKIEGGGTPTRSNPDYFGGSIPWVTPTDLPSVGTITHGINTRDCLTQAGVLRSSAKIIPPSSILFSSRATIGKIAINDVECTTNQGFANLIPDPGIIDTEFLAYLLLGYREEIKRLAGKTTFLEVPRGRLRNFTIFVPSLKEQRRIVARIKECMERVEEIENLRAEAATEREALFESVIEAEFSRTDGKERKLAEVCGIKVPLINPQETPYFKKPHVGGANIETGTGRLLNLKTSEQEGLKSSKFPFDASMVLYNKIRPYLKKVARPNFEGICSADMYPLSPEKEKLDRDYLFYLLLSRRFTDYAIRGSNRAGMPKVNRRHLFDFGFPFPSLKEQKSVVERLNEAFSAILGLREESKDIDTDLPRLRDAVLRKAFLGEL